MRSYGNRNSIYDDYYWNQAGSGLPVFIGGKNYRGRGLGSLLGGIARSVIPLLKSTGKAVLREAGRTGLNIAQDVISGQNIKTAAKRRGREAGHRLLDNAVHKAMGIQPAPPGEPAMKRIKTLKSRTNAISRKRTKGRRVHRDIFS